LFCLRPQYKNEKVGFSILAKEKKSKLKAAANSISLHVSVDVETNWLFNSIRRRRE
jgi:hypothetical protein